LELIYKTDNGRLVQGDNIEVMKKLKDNSIHSCISDFPYDLSFMGKKWDTTGNFYEWCKDRAEPLYRIIKPGGYVCIFGHPKTNHRMKCAFEDAGFNIVEEIDWVYGTGFPKNQDIGKLFDKKAGAEREIVGYLDRNDRKLPSGEGGTHGTAHQDYCNNGRETINLSITEPTTDRAKKWNGWKTAGLKPAHEPITIFQKPLEGTYINNINTYGVGAMNIDACRIPTSQEDKDTINAKASKNPTTNYSDSEERIYGAYAEDKSMPANEIGRFPANMIFDSSMGEVLDGQSGISKSTGGKSGHTGIHEGGWVEEYYGDKKPGLGDIGGASRYFLKINEEDFVPFFYCAKATKKEKGEGNIHVTVKPKTLIKWLIKLVTPIDGKTIDITAGSGTHGLACEELNRDEGYKLKWVNVEMLNTEKEPYCEIAMNRIKKVI